MPEPFQIEPMGDHACLVRARYSGGVIKTRFEASPAVVDELDAAQADEQRVIEETALYLTGRQPVMDLPRWSTSRMSRPPTETTTSRK